MGCSYLDTAWVQLCTVGFGVVASCNDDHLLDAICNGLPDTVVKPGSPGILYSTIFVRSFERDQKLRAAFPTRSAAKMFSADSALTGPALGTVLRAPGLICKVGGLTLAQHQGHF